MRSIFLAGLAFFMMACGGDHSSQSNTPKTSAQPFAANMAFAETSLVKKDSSAVVSNEPAACQPEMKKALDGTMQIELLEQFVKEFESCDPVRGDFTLDGKIRDDNFIAGAPAGLNTLANMQGFIYYFRDIGPAFENLPLLKRREILNPAMKVVAEAVVRYVHRDVLTEYVTKLDWEKDIDAVNPAWYEATKWPESRIQRIDISKFGKLSKTDLWVRMFWRRRGEVVFKAAKAAVLEAMKNKG